MKRGVVTLLAVAAVAWADAPVYRTTDGAGYPVFSDRSLPGARPLPAKRVNTYAPPVAEPGPASEPTRSSTDPSSYESLRIVFPEAGATVRANGGNVRVEGRVVPDLAEGHRAAASLDGQTAACAVQEGGRFACPLSAVARGPHSVRVVVLDEAGAAVTRTEVTRFHVQRTAIVRPAPIARDAGMH